MKHRVTVQVPVEKRGFFGRKKIVYEERTIVVDGPTYRKIKQAQEDAELDEFLRRFVAVGHVPPDAREAVFERFRTLYNRALTELQREENEKTLKSE